MVLDLVSYFKNALSIWKPFPKSSFRGTTPYFFPDCLSYGSKFLINMLVNPVIVHLLLNYHLSRSSALHCSGSSFSLRLKWCDFANDVRGRSRVPFGVISNLWKPLFLFCFFTKLLPNHLLIKPLYRYDIPYHPLSILGKRSIPSHHSLSTPFQICTSFSILIAQEISERLPVEKRKKPDTIQFSQYLYTDKFSTHSINTSWLSLSIKNFSTTTYKSRQHIFFPHTNHNLPTKSPLKPPCFFTPRHVNLLPRGKKENPTSLSYT